MKKNDIILYGAGDTMPYKPDPDELFVEVKPLFSAENAIAFCQLEAGLSRAAKPVPQARFACSSDKTLPACLKRNGIDVVSFASNHAMDYGRESFLETLDIVEQAGLPVIGVGRDEASAREAKYVELNGTKVAFIGYGSSLPQDYWAEEDRPGCNPARGVVAYVPYEHDQPGTAVEMFSFPHPRDLKKLEEDVQLAKKNADIVVVSFHWGLHFVRAAVADYQRYYARFAIDAGADLILGHHAHTLKPIEMYKGKAIFYSLGNFALNNGFNPDDVGPDVKAFFSTSRQKVVDNIPKEEPMPGRDRALGNYSHTLAKCVISDKKIQRVSFIPTFREEDEYTRVLKADDPHFGEIVQYMKDITAEVGFNTTYTVEGDEVVLS